MRSIKARLATLEAQESALPPVTIAQARAQLVAALEQVRQQPPTNPPVLTGVHAQLAQRLEALIEQQ